MAYYNVFFGPGPLREYYPKVHDEFVSTIKSYKFPFGDFLLSEVEVVVTASHLRDQEKTFRLLEKMLTNAKPWQYHDVAKLANKYLNQGYRLKAVDWAKTAIQKNQNDEFLKAQCVAYYNELLNFPGAQITNPAYPYQVKVDL